MLLENVRLAFRSFSSSRMRAFLSVLGIVIGVASVIAITTLGRSATMSVQAEITRGGLGTVVVQTRPGNDPKLMRLFTPELGSRLERSLAGTTSVTPVQAKSTLMRYGQMQHKGNVMAVTEAAAEVFDLSLTEGRFVSAMDRERRSSVAVLGAEAANVLFPTSGAVGKHIRLYFKRPRSFTVIGVTASRPDAVGLSFDSSVFIPFETYGSRIEPIARVGRYAVGVRDGADVLTVSRQLEEFFLDLTGNRSAVRIVSPSTVAEMFEAVTSTLNAFLTGIAAIALIVGGVGIMNIMLVSVTERTKEIGIRKALGATPGVIRGQFLTEAVTLTLVGGLLGIVLGTTISYWGTWLLGWSFSPNPAAYPLALLFSSATGIFFGLYPAMRASRLDPVQALSYE